MLTYDEAKTMMAAAQRPERGKPLQNNTRLYQRGDDYAVCLHSTDVVTIHPDGTYTLDSGGWRTVTTKARINEYAPVRLAAERGTWYLFGRGQTWAEREKLAMFIDGIRIDGSGRPVSGAPTDREADARIAAGEDVDKMIRAYIRGFVAAIKAGRVESPSAGDCFGCQMVPNGEDAGKARAGVFGVDHYLSHFRERYYVPSLLWRAMQRRGDPSFVWHLAMNGHSDMAADDLRAFLRGVREELIGERIAEMRRAAA